MSEDQLSVLRDIESPQGGWQYTTPETGLVIRDEFMKTLYPRVRAHYEANDLPPPSREEVEDAACRETTGAAGLCGKRPPKQRAPGMPHLTPALLERFFRSIWEVLKSGKLESREEAERRYEICKTCPLATDVGYCKNGCTGLGNLIKKALPNNPLSEIEDPEKAWCVACGCHLISKCWLPNKALDKAEKVKPPYWEGCWRVSPPPS